MSEPWYTLSTLAAGGAAAFLVTWGVLAFEERFIWPRQLRRLGRDHVGRRRR